MIIYTCINIHTYITYIYIYIYIYINEERERNREREDMFVILGLFERISGRRER
jgi:hypothetical protein